MSSNSPCRLPLPITDSVFNLYAELRVARRLREVSKTVWEIVYERTRDTIGPGRWRAFKAGNGSMLFQQLHYDKESNEFHIHSIMTNIGDRALYERSTRWVDGGTSYCDAFPLTRLAPQRRFSRSLGIRPEWFYRRRAMALVGGGEDFTFVPAWAVPAVFNGGGYIVWKFRLIAHGSFLLEVEMNGILDLSVEIDGSRPTRRARSLLVMDMEEVD